MKTWKFCLLSDNSLFFIIFPEPPNNLNNHKQWKFFNMYDWTEILWDKYNMHGNINTNLYNTY